MTLPEIIAARKAAEESKPELPKKTDGHVYVFTRDDDIELRGGKGQTGENCRSAYYAHAEFEDIVRWAATKLYGMVDGATTTTSSTPTDLKPPHEWFDDKVDPFEPEKIVPEWNGIKPKSGYVGERITLGDGSVIELTEWRPPKIDEGWWIGDSDEAYERWQTDSVLGVAQAATRDFESPRWFCKIVTGE